MPTYKIIVKVSADKFVKYHTTNLITFTTFLDKSFEGWRWFNVFDKNGIQVANFTTKNTQIVVRLNQSIKDSLERISDAQIVHISDIVRTAITNHIQMMDSTN